MFAYALYALALALAIVAGNVLDSKFGARLDAVGARLAAAINRKGDAMRAARRSRR